jgi:hypothetical protein
MPINSITNTHLQARHIPKDVTINHVIIVTIPECLEFGLISGHGKIWTAIFLDVFIQQPASRFVHHGKQQNKVSVDVFMFPVHVCPLFADD